MTQRERVMAYSVGALAVLVVGYFVANSALQHYSAKQDAVSDKERELAAVDAELMQAKQKDRALKNIAYRALPEAREANNLYAQWLRSTLENCNLDVQFLNTSPSYVEKGKEYGKLRFDVKATARLDDLTTWLHGFNTVNCLHRIKSLTITPVDNSRLLNVTVEIEAVSLLKIPKEQYEEVEVPSFFALKVDRGKSEADIRNFLIVQHDVYMNRIAGRNAFGPPNRAPTIQPIPEINAQIGKQVEVMVKGRDKKDGTDDPDNDELLFYRVVDAEMPEGEFALDNLKGAFHWTPKKTGTYKATVEVVDSGVPRKSTRQVFTINVKEPSKVVDAGPKSPPPKPTFDIARVAYVTAVVQEAGADQVWITERTTGKSRKLKLGDAVQIGSIDGKVSRIDSNGVEVQTSDTKFFTKVGQALGAAASQVGGS